MFDEHRHKLSHRRQIENAQQREVLTRLREAMTDSRILEPFEEEDLERMIRDVTHKPGTIL